MYVEVGVTEAILSNYQEGKLVHRHEKGEFVTQFTFPKGHTVEEAASDVVGGLRAHMANDRPAWVESDNKGLKDMLCDHFKVDKRKKKTPAWGNGSIEEETTDED